MKTEGEKDVIFNSIVDGARRLGAERGHGGTVRACTQCRLIWVGPDDYTKKQEAEHRHHEVVVGIRAVSLTEALRKLPKGGAVALAEPARPDAPDLSKLAKAAEPSPPRRTPHHIKRQPFQFPGRG